MTMKSFLKGIIYFSMAIVPFLAWYVSESTFFPFITGRGFAFRTLVEISFAAWVILAFLEPAFRPKKSIVFYAYSAFLLVLFTANILGSNSYLSFFSNYERMEGWFTHLHLFLYFAILYSVYKTTDDWRKLFAWFFVSGIAVLTEGIFQLFGQKEFFLTVFLGEKLTTIMNTAYPTHMGNGLRLDSTLGNAAYYGIYTLFFVFFGALFAVKANKWKGQQNFSSMFYVLGFVILVLQQNVLLVIANSLLETKENIAIILNNLSLFLWFVGIVGLLWSGINLVKDIAQNKLGSWTYILFAFISLISLGYTLTRGSYMGLIGGIAIAGLTFVFAKRKDGNTKNTKKIKNIILGSLFVFTILFSSVFAFRDSNFVKNNPILNRVATIKIINIAFHPMQSYNMIADISNNYPSLVEYFGEGTIVSRFLNAKISIEGISKSTKTLLLGYGQENYTTVFGENFDPRMYSQETWFDRAHDVFMDWLVAGGIFGLITYLALYFTSLYMLWFGKGKNNIEVGERSILTGMLVAYFIHNIFVFDNLVSYIVFIFLLAYISSRTRDTESHIKSELSKHEKHHSTIVAGVSGFAIAFSLVLFVITVWKPLMVNLDLITAFRKFPTSYENLTASTTESFKKFSGAYNSNTFGKTETLEQMLQKSLILAQVDYTKLPAENREASIKSSSEFISFASENSVRDVTLNPTVRGLSLIGSYALQTGDKENALKYLEEAYNINPSKQAVAFEYIQALIANNKTEEALKVSEKTYNFDKTYEQAKNVYETLQKEVLSSAKSLKK